MKILLVIATGIFGVFLLKGSKNELEKHSRNRSDSVGDSSSSQQSSKFERDSVQHRTVIEPEPKPVTETVKDSSSLSTVKDDKNAGTTDKNTPADNH
jgi:hypothetical protein